MAGPRQCHGAWRLAASALGCLMVASLLAGCWDRRELEDTAFVLALGLNGQPGRDLEITAAVAVPHKASGGSDGGGGASGGGKPFAVTSVRARSFAEALNLMDSYIGRKTSLLHTKVIILGEDLARSEGFRQVLDGLNRFRELRGATHVFVAKGPPRDLLDRVKPVIEKDPLRYLEFLPLTADETGLAPREALLNDLIATTSTPGGAAISQWIALRPDANEDQAGGSNKEAPARPSVISAPAGEPGAIPRSGGPNVEMMGGAVFNRARMVGTLTGAEMRMVNLVRGDFARAIIAVPDLNMPDTAVSLRLRQGSPPVIQPQWRANGRIAITARLSLEADLLAVQSGTDYTSGPELAKLEQAVASHITTEIQQLYRRSQQELHADVFGLGYKAARLFATYPEWQEYDWEAHYSEVQADFQVQVRIRRFGTELAPVVGSKGG